MRLWIGFQVVCASRRTSKVILNQSEDHYAQLELRVAGCGAVLIDAPGRSISTYVVEEGEVAKL